MSEPAGLPEAIADYVETHHRRERVMTTTGAGYFADLSAATCRHCGTTGQIRVETRTEFHARPLGTYSLAGQWPKVSAARVEWPWAVCGACGHESRGEMST